MANQPNNVDQKNAELLSNFVTLFADKRKTSSLGTPIITITTSSTAQQTSAPDINVVGNVAVGVTIPEETAATTPNDGLAAAIAPVDQTGSAATSIQQAVATSATAPAAPTIDVSSVCITPQATETIIKGNISGGKVWGNNPYTEDSDLSVAIVHAGLAKPGETVLVQKKEIKYYDSYTGSSNNGINTLNYAGFCGFKLTATSVIPANKPVVQIKNYKYVNNKLLILLNVLANSGDITEANYLQLFTPDQIKVFQEIIKNKGYNSSKSNLIFSASLNQEKYFIIYRTDKKPESYEDIINPQNIIKKLSIDKFETALEDKIQPNKKYYYCFQIEDAKKILSDVTLVYEMELVDQSGTVYMKEQVFKPEKKNTFIKQKEFENKIRIFPSDAQINIPPNLLEISYTNGNYISFYVKEHFFSILDPKYIAINSYFQNKTKFIKTQSQSAGMYKKETIAYIQPQNVENIIKLSFNNQEIRDSLDISFSSFKDKQISYTELKNLLRTNILENKNIKYITFPSFKITFNNGNITSFIDLLQKYDPYFYFVLHTQNYDFLFNYDDSKGTIVESQQKQMKIVSPNDILSSAEKDSIFANIQKNIKVVFTSSDFLNQTDPLFTDNKVFKARIESQNSKKKFDINITYNLQIPEKLQLLQDSNITKQFEILKTEKI